MKAGQRAFLIVAWLAVTAVVPALTLAETRDAGKTEMRIVAFGTSLTARGGWQDSLQSRLAACLHRPVQVITVARSGATSEWAVANVKAVVAARPDVVLFEFYANDASLHRFFTVSASRANVASILATMRKDIPDARLILQVMNPFSSLRGLIRPFVADYIEAHRQAAQTYGAEIVDHGAAWHALGPDALAAAIPDGAHPDPAVASRIVVPTLARAIGGPAC